ncbi:MAG: adenylate/guanylate cyclase domain-containing protein, partial [Myxococcaceae bacterium]
RACRAALETREAITALRAELNAQGLPDVYTRMGLNSAQMLVGNIGSEQLIDYTAIGDGMNLAARLEGANKAYGTDILIGEGTFLRAQDYIEAREIDLVRVAGKSEAERIYELMALKGRLTNAQRVLRADYSRALVDYRAQRFAAAAEVLEKYPQDGASITLLARCREALEHPPVDFDGVADLEK